jgi:hypothetical protein
VGAEPLAAHPAAGPLGTRAVEPVAFPELVSATPGGQGWGGATCDLGSGPGVVALISCEYPTGIHLEVLQFADTAGQDAKVEEIRPRAEPGGKTWAAADGGADAGGLFLSTADAAPWMFLTFWDTDLDLFSVYVDSEGHSLQELQDSWFADAPLPTD